MYVKKERPHRVRKFRVYEEIWRRGSLLDQVREHRPQVLVHVAGPVLDLVGPEHLAEKRTIDPGVVRMVRHLRHEGVDDRGTRTPVEVEVALASVFGPQTVHPGPVRGPDLEGELGLEAHVPGLHDRHALAVDLRLAGRLVVRLVQLEVGDLRAEGDPLGEVHEVRPGEVGARPEAHPRVADATIPPRHAEAVVTGLRESAQEDRVARLGLVVDDEHRAALILAPLDLAPVGGLAIATVDLSPDDGAEALGRLDLHETLLVVVAELPTPALELVERDAPRAHVDGHGPGLEPTQENGELTLAETRNGHWTLPSLSFSRAEQRTWKNGAYSIIRRQVLK